MEPAMSSDMERNTTRGYRFGYPAVAPSVEAMTPAKPSTRLPYDDASTPAEMSADCRATGDNLRLRRAAEAAVSRQSPSLHFEDYPREVGKRDIEISEAAARIANALHLHLD